jgi:hypothetical protein
MVCVLLPKMKGITFSYQTFFKKSNFVTGFYNKSYDLHYHDRLLWFIVNGVGIRFFQYVLIRKYFD